MAFVKVTQPVTGYLYGSTSNPITIRPGDWLDTSTDLNHLIPTSVVRQESIKEVKDGKLVLKGESQYGAGKGNETIDIATGHPGMVGGGQPLAFKIGLGVGAGVPALGFLAPGVAAGESAAGGASGGAGGVGATQAAVNSTAAAAGGGSGAATGAGAAAGGFGKFATDTAKALTAINFGNAQGRIAEAQANIQQHDALLNEMALRLRKATNQQEATGVDYNRQVRGGLLQGLQDANIQAPPGVHVGTVTGGLRPSAITGAPQIGSDMQRAATLDLLGQGNPNYGGVTALSGITTPTLPPLQTPNAGQKILGGVGPALNLVGSNWNWLRSL